MGRPKQFDVRFEVKITKTQDAMLDVLSSWTGVPKAEIVREMLNMEVAHGFFRETYGLPDATR